MDDDFLHRLRQDPSPTFSTELRTRLQHDPAAAGSRASGWPIQRITVSVAAVALTAGLFLVPAVRASAQAFLDLFRVVNFAAVPVGEDRVKQLSSPQLNLEHMIGEQVEVLAEPGPAQPFLTPEAAGAAMGMQVRVPSWLPNDLVRTDVKVEGERAVRLTGSTTKLRQLLDTLALSDVRIPNGLDGQTATLRVPPAVTISYQRGERTVGFIQARTPQVTLPAGLDLPTLGEIGLRVLGLDKAEAHRFAQALDWHTTLLVPVPPDATSFHQVQVGGHRGLVIETNDPTAKIGRGSMVLWSDGERVYGIRGALPATDILTMANSVR